MSSYVSLSSQRSTRSEGGRRVLMELLVSMTGAMVRPVGGLIATALRVRYCSWLVAISACKLRLRHAHAARVWHSMWWPDFASARNGATFQVVPHVEGQVQA